MHIHIMGICGTFMGGIAVLAKQAGYTVTGSDQHVYPPMSTQLEAQGISLMAGYHPDNLKPEPDMVIIGNAISRGNPELEAVLNQNLAYTSGPQWLAESLLRDRWVLAVSGTHGKTTTTSMLAWILEYAHLNPGFLVGGVPHNFGISARWGDAPFFVIEADEYDSAFFDKRPKFIHYRPRTLIMNNLEFDHADIYESLSEIKKQFAYLSRTVPGNGLIVHQADDNLTDVLNSGVWTPTQSVGALDNKQYWSVTDCAPDGSQFTVLKNGKKVGTVDWDLLGMHNVHNALSAIASAQHAGVPVHIGIEALAEFKNVKRRMEVRGVINNITVYDDFAHHPTAIATTLAGLRAKVGVDQKITAVIEFGSYTMKTGVHADTIAPSLKEASRVVFAKPEDDWGLSNLQEKLTVPANICDDVDGIVNSIVDNAEPGEHILVMSNKGFAGIHDKLLKQLQQRFEAK